MGRRKSQLLAHRLRIARQRRRIERAPHAPAIGAIDLTLAGDYARFERGVGVCGPSVIVLDDVDPRLCECRRHAHEIFQGRADRLERRAAQRPAKCAGQATQAFDAQCRPAEAHGQGVRQRHGRHFDVIEQGAVAEQHVHQLAGIVADALAAKQEGCKRAAIGLRREAIDTGHDIAQHASIGHRLGRHLDALLECQFMRALLGGWAGCAQAVDRAHCVSVHAVILQTREISPARASADPIGDTSRVPVAAGWNDGIAGHGVGERSRPAKRLRSPPAFSPTAQSAFGGQANPA